MTKKEIEAETARAVERASTAQEAPPVEFKTIFGEVVEAPVTTNPEGE